MRFYGKWGGNRSGTEEDTTKCIVQVWPSQGWAIGSQCSRKRGHGEQGLFCWQHKNTKLTSGNVPEDK